MATQQIRGEQISDTQLAALASLADAPGVLTNNGSGVLSWGAGGGGGISGTGTTGTLSKWASSASLTDSIMTEAASVVTVAGEVSINTNGQAILFSSRDAVSSGGGRNIWIGGGGASVTGGSSLRGSANVAVGYQALLASTTGFDNIAVGYAAAQALTTGNANIVIGRDALLTATTATGNTAVGYQVLLNGTTATANTAIGYRAMWLATSAIRNTVLGGDALLTNTTGNYNVALGYEALFSLTGSDRSVAVGYGALYNNLTGAENVGLGFQALYNVTTGVDNTGVGYRTGLGITTGNYNTILGANVTGLPTNLSNTVILADGQGNQRLYIDSNGNAGIGTTTPSTVNGISLSAQRLLHVSSASTVARLTVTGTGGAAFDMIDPSAPANTRWYLCQAFGGNFHWRAITDAGSVAFTLLSGSLSTGVVTFPQAVTITGGLSIGGGSAISSSSNVALLNAANTFTNTVGQTIAGVARNNTPGLGVLILSDTAKVAFRQNASNGLSIDQWNGAVWAEHLTVSTTGNFGIGEAAPATLLDIKAANAQIRLNRAATGAGNYSIMKWSTAGTTKFFLGIDGDVSDTTLTLWDQAASVRVMQVTGGKVGVGGILAPVAVLDVLSSWTSQPIGFRVEDQNGYGVYVSNENTLNFNYGVNADTNGYLNYQGYQNGTTRFRSLVIADGKTNPIATFNGATGVVTFNPTGVVHSFNGYLSVNTVGTTSGGFGDGIYVAGWNALGWDGVNALVFGGYRSATWQSVKVYAGASGGVVLTAGATAWAAISDVRRKNILAPLSEDALDKLGRLTAVYYALKDDPTQTRRVGLLAQEVQAVLPEAVTPADDGTLTLRYTDLIPLLVSASHETSRRLAALERNH